MKAHCLLFIFCYSLLMSRSILPLSDRIWILLGKMGWSCVFPQINIVENITVCIYRALCVHLILSLLLKNSTRNSIFLYRHWVIYTHYLQFILMITFFCFVSGFAKSVQMRLFICSARLGFQQSSLQNKGKILNCKFLFYRIDLHK